VERAQDGLLGRIAKRPVVDRLREHGHSQDIGEQDELLAGFIAFLACGSEELDSGIPFLLSELHLFDEVVQVCDQAGQYFVSASPEN
jgi:hypothetical protein